MFTSTESLSDTGLAATQINLPADTLLGIEANYSTDTSQYEVIRRNGKLTRFNVSKISVAVTKAFLAVEGGQAAASTRIHETVRELTGQIIDALFRRLPDGGTVHIEDIQDQVELALMRNGHHKIARAYVLYREQHARERKEKAGADEQSAMPVLQVKRADGSLHPLDQSRLQTLIGEACAGLENVDAERVFEGALRNLFDGIKQSDVGQGLTLSARGLIDQEPNYSQVAARLLLADLRGEALAFLEMADAADGEADAGILSSEEMSARYPAYFCRYIQRAAQLELLSPELTRYDLEKLAQALKPERDQQFAYLGLQTLYDRYFIESLKPRP